MLRQAKGYYTPCQCNLFDCNLLLFTIHLLDSQTSPFKLSSKPLFVRPFTGTATETIALLLRWLHYYMQDVHHELPKLKASALIHQRQAYRSKAPLNFVLLADLKSCFADMLFAEECSGTCIWDTVIVARHTSDCAYNCQSHSGFLR